MPAEVKSKQAGRQSELKENLQHHHHWVAAKVQEVHPQATWFKLGSQDSTVGAYRALGSAAREVQVVCFKLGFPVAMGCGGGLLGSPRHWWLAGGDPPPGPLSLCCLT